MIAFRGYGVKPRMSDDYTYHTELIPQMSPYYDHEWTGTYVPGYNPLWLADLHATLTEWIQQGINSFSFDQFNYKSNLGQKPGLIKTIEQIRELSRTKDPESTFSGESEVDLELDSAILDYTWNWRDYVDAGPIVSVLRFPRLNCNLEDSALAAKRCFAEGLYLSAMPSKIDEENGSAFIREKPELGRALKELAVLRKQYLPYFVKGTALGESLLSQSAPEFVRAYRLGDQLLAFVLND